MEVPPNSSTDVLVIGEALIDIVDDGMVTTEHPGGSPANVALGLGRRGVSVSLLTDVGRDPRGSRIVRHLERSGVRVLGESLSDRPTDTATAILGSDGSAVYRFDVRWDPAPVPLHLAPTLVHTGSLAAFLEPGRSIILECLERTSAAIVTFDPNIRPALLGTHTEALGQFVELASRADIVKMSHEDAEWLYPKLTPSEVSRTIRSLGPRLVVVTLGADGALLTAADEEAAVPASAVAVSDTIGAGDTYMASLIVDALTLSDRAIDPGTITRLGERAAHAASITVSRAGADLPWKGDLDTIPQLSN